MAQGIYINEHQFVRFSEAGRAASLSEQIATRGRSTDFFNLGTLLPNPDPILKARGQDLRVYRELRSDAHVGGCVRRRKAAVKALEWGLDREKAKSRVAKNVEAIFADLQLERIIGEILDAVLYGYQPLEVTWGKVGGLVVPVNVESKPAEWFGYDDNNLLRFKSRSNPVNGEELPPMKFLVARQEPTYANPYGFPDLSMCFWPIVFKKGGVKFWLNFAEKYGTPWAVGKTPRGTQPSEKAQLADNLEAMIQDAVAVIPDDSSVEILEAAGKSASADLYERLVMYCRSEVSIALTGTNQTVEANSNRASATAGLEVADDIRDGDAGIVAETFNELIRWTVELNWGSAERPVWSMWDQESQDSLQASRDKSLSDAGAKFSNAYFIRAYRYQEGDLLPQGASQDALAKTPPAQFSEGSPAATSYADLATETMAKEAGQAWEYILKYVRQIVAKSGNLEEVRDKLLQAFSDLPVDRLAKVMELGFSAAELAGVADVVQETGVGGKS
jgi:phage gp29-like protein